MHLPGLKVTFKNIAILLHQLPFAVLQVIFPQPGVAVAIGPCHRSYTIFLAIFERSGIFITVGQTEDAFSGSFAVNVFAFVQVAVLEFIDTFSVLDVTPPVA